MRAGGLNAKVRYGVFEIDGQWSLWCESHRLGWYSGIATATTAGQRAASQAIGSGFDAELYVMGIGGELRRAEPQRLGLG